MKKLVLIAISLTALGCLNNSDNGGNLNSNSMLFKISDGAHEGTNDHFYFLPPLVDEPSVSGVFDSTVTPVVEICALAGTDCDNSLPLVAQYTTQTGPGSETVRLIVENEHYIVNWHTDEFNLDDQITYRISVFVENQLLGFADVDAVNSGKELKQVNSEEFIPLLDGRTLPIKFRIEEGALGPICVEPPPNLIGWWPLDETSGTTAKDIENDNDGTHQNGPVFAPGMVSGALEFDGVDDFIDIPHDPTLNITEEITIDAWIHFTGAASGTYIIASKKPSQVNNYQFGIHNGRLGFWYRSGGVGTGHLFLSDSNVATNEFVHAAARYVSGDATSIELYMNGTLVNGSWFVGNGTEEMLANTGNLLIGARRTDKSILIHSFSGIIDEVEVFNRALTATEIQSIYAAGNVGKCKQ